MDNIQKSVVFVLLTSGSLAFLFESTNAFPEKTADPAVVQPATVEPPKAESKTTEEVESSEESEDESDEFGDPVMETDPIDGEETANESTQDDTGEDQGNSGSTSVDLTSTNASANSDTAAREAPAPTVRPVVQGTRIPRPPTPLPVGG
jgi:hypothetical protein